MMVMDDNRNFSIRRSAGIFVGIVVHSLFAITVYYLVGFLQGGPPQPSRVSATVNALLALQFSVVHSLLLWPGVRRRLERSIGAAFYGLFFCAMTCATLLLTIYYWQVGSWAVWQLIGWPRTLMQTAFIGAWVVLLYSLSLNGLGYQTGWTPWWHWVRRLPLPRREFKPRGAYLYLRHPVYLSFLGLVWFTPDMTSDRAVLTAVWTVYIFIGSYLKDLRLLHYLGDRYRQYQAQVPGYPGVFLGPLARRQALAVRIVQPVVTSVQLAADKLDDQVRERVAEDYRDSAAQAYSNASTSCYLMH